MINFNFDETIRYLIDKVNNDKLSWVSAHKFLAERARNAESSTRRRGISKEAKKAGAWEYVGRIGCVLNGVWFDGPGRENEKEACEMIDRSFKDQADRIKKQISGCNQIEGLDHDKQ